MADDVSMEDLGVVEETAIMMVITNGHKLDLSGRKAAATTLAGPDSPGKPTEETTESVSSGAGDAGADDASAGGAGDSKMDSDCTSDPPAAASISLKVKALSGEGHLVNVAAGSLVSDLKREVEPIAGVESELICLVYDGRELEDKERCADLSASGHAIHVTLRFPSKEHAFGKVVSTSSHPLLANCPYCHTAGATFDPRPLCPTCTSTGANGEAILVLGSGITPGETTWGDLRDVAIQCFSCGFEGQAAIGFLCRARADNAPCVSRKQRKLQYLYDGSGDDDKLFRTINALLGYAHAGGLA